MEFANYINYAMKSLLKNFGQIKDIKNSFVVSDDIEIGFSKKIPLWAFGFLY